MVGLKYGEIVLAIKPSGLMSLLKLGEAKSYKMRVPHIDIVAHNSAVVAINGVVFRRPTLAEYTNLLERSTAPNYPKDISAILSMLDIGPHTRVMEAGAGSGALTLHLSRAVWETGRVITFENVPSHMETAKHNFKKWCQNWRCLHGRDWPNNVDFVQGDVGTAGECSAASDIDCVALDIAHPGPVLKKLLRNLRPNTPISVYLPNISQFVELSRFIQQEQLELQVEEVLEAEHRAWLVKPATIKSLGHNTKLFEDKFICRPKHRQRAHTGFIGLLKSRNKLFTSQAIVGSTCEERCHEEDVRCPKGDGRHLEEDGTLFEQGHTEGDPEGDEGHLKEDGIHSDGKDAECFNQSGPDELARVT